MTELQFESVSVEKAISKGRKMVSYPGMLVMFGFMGLTFLLGVQKGSSVWIWPVGLLSSFVLSWLYWSVAITKWKVWAFENVRNVHELRQRAIQEQLIWKNSSIFNKTEIWSRTDRQKWDLLQDKFSKKDEFVYESDLTIPLQTIIYYAKGKNFVEMTFMLVCLASGGYLIVVLRSYVLGAIVSVGSGYMAFRECREATNTTPQITLNEEGIETINTEFYNWRDIEDEDVEMEHSGKNVHWYLNYKHPNGIERLLVDDYDIGRKELQKLLREYRGRSLRKVATSR